MQDDVADVGIQNELSVLEASLSEKNCRSAFAAAGITPDERVQYHTSHLDSKFDQDGILKPSMLQPNITYMLSILLHFI